MGSFVRDLRHALRGLARTPGFAAVSVLTLAIGIAAVTTVFAWVQAAFLAPLPGVPEPGSLRLFSGIGREGGLRSLSIPTARDFQKAGETGELPFDFATFSLQTVSLMEGERTERLWVSLVSGRFFEVLGVRAAVGRTFTPEEDSAPDAHRVAVLSHRLWQRRFAGDPELVGRTIRLNGLPYTVIGIAPRELHGREAGLSADLWLPVAMQARVMGGQKLWDERGWSWMDGIARLRPGVTDGQAQAALATMSARLARAWPGPLDGVTFHLYRFWTAPGTEERRLALLVAAAMAVLVLVLACANVANLLLVRALARRREAAIRLALGAGRAGLLRLLLSEGLALSILGGGIGLLLTLWARRVFDLLTPVSDLPEAPPPPLDLQVLAFAAAVSLLTGVLFSLVPALQMASPHLSGVLRDEGAAVAGGRKGRLRSGLVVVQVALSCVLLISAGLFARSLREASRLDIGFSARDLLLGSMDVFPNGYDEARGRTFYRELLRRVSALPGVESATVAMQLPLSGNYSATSAEIEGYVPKPQEMVILGYNVVGPGYFETLGIPILQGRGITHQDGENAPAVAVINQDMARRYWPDGKALGGVIRAHGKEITVIGVVPDGDILRLREVPEPYMYIPFFQRYQSAAILHVRTAGDPAQVAGPVRERLRQIDPALLLSDVKTMEEHLRGSTFEPRLLAVFLGGLGTVALLLSTVGLYSVIRYAVSQRTRELGVRLALGARPAEVARLVLGQGLVLALLGAGLGLAAALATSRLLASQLFGVSATDPAVFTAVVVLLGAVSAVASWLPARLAAEVDPLVALQTD